MQSAPQTRRAHSQTSAHQSRGDSLAGSSVYVDRGFLAVYMPLLDDYLHYRLVDVSTVKEVAKRWYPRVYFASPEKKGNHRALGDIRESIAELRYYRDAIFVDQPGPNSSQAKAIGQTHVVDHGTEVAVQESPETD
ncbi:MAG: oligoribonuclease [Actinomycetales bacterium]|nr:oligoribonuclease [Actinomycetales bacterium]